MPKDCGRPSPSLLLIKGRGSGLDRPTQPIQPSGAQGIEADPLPQSAAARFPAFPSKARAHRLPPSKHGGHVAGEQKAKGQMRRLFSTPWSWGAGALETTTQAHSVNELRLCAFPFLRGRREPPLYHDVTHVCGNHPTHDPHDTHDPPCRTFNAGRGEAQRMRSYYGKICPTCPHTILGLAQQHVALMCGPGPGAPVGVQSRGSPFDPFTCAWAVRATRHGRA